MLMACELIVFIALLTYTSTRHQSTTCNTKASSTSVLSSAAGSSITPRAMMSTNGNSGSSRSGRVEDLGASWLTSLSSQPCHRAVMNSTDMSPTSAAAASLQRRRSVDHMHTTSLWTDESQTAAIKSGQCFVFPSIVFLLTGDFHQCDGLPTLFD